MFELSNEGGFLKANELVYDPKGFGDPSPKVTTVEDEEAAISYDTSGEETKENIVKRRVLPDVASIPASRLVRAAALDSMEEITCEVPRMVINLDTKEELFFNAVDKGRGFKREVKILAELFEGRTTRLACI